ncbi:unnamed protein product [Protopolystoma xenopodis]|uniref:Uncharacterized protein n=1 Tax=Protopolystoma xenopodis TaxID=117903 RepID=A0A448XKA0_9PLAT|nr:unnamed protein product [Protopolystoma xenopodis]
MRGRGFFPRSGGSSGGGGGTGSLTGSSALVSVSGSSGSLLGPVCSVSSASGPGGTGGNSGSLPSGLGSNLNLGIGLTGSASCLVSTVPGSAASGRPGVVDVFRSRAPNTSRPPSMHVDDFSKLEDEAASGLVEVSLANSIQLLSL